MSTTGIDSWALDLANVTTIYPLQGLEGLMVIVAVVCWLAWHVWQTKHESNEYAEDIKKYGDAETLRKAIDEGS